MSFFPPIEIDESRWPEGTQRNPDAVAAHKTLRKRLVLTRRLEGAAIKYMAVLVMVAAGSFAVMPLTGVWALQGERDWSGLAFCLAALCFCRSISMVISLSKAMGVPIFDLARRRVLSADRGTRTRFFVYVTVLLVFLVVVGLTGR
jgi:hypothetical protein